MAVISEVVLIWGRVEGTSGSNRYPVSKKIPRALVLAICQKRQAIRNSGNCNLKCKTEIETEKLNNAYK